MSDDCVIEGVDYGPLAPLIEHCRGDQGMDVSPEPGGDEPNPYFESIAFEAIGDVTNTTRLEIYGSSFAHTDANTFTRADV